MINTALEVSPNDGAIAEFAQRALTDIERNFRIAVEAGKAAGEIATSVDPDQTASALLSLLLGLHVLARSRPEPDLLRAVSAQAAKLLTSSA
jgi:TetR/AcrR family transcriptional repressor of nem operon